MEEIEGRGGRGRAVNQIPSPAASTAAAAVVHNTSRQRLHRSGSGSAPGASGGGEITSPCAMSVARDIRQASNSAREEYTELRFSLANPWTGRPELSSPLR